MALVRAKTSLVKDGRSLRQCCRSTGYVLCKFRVANYSFPTFFPAKHLYSWCSLSQSPFDSDPQISPQDSQLPVHRADLKSNRLAMGCVIRHTLARNAVEVHAGN